MDQGSTTFFADVIDELGQRAARSLVSKLSPISPPLRQHLHERLERLPGEAGSFLTDPVFEAGFGWELEGQSMASLSGDLLTGALVNAMDAPPPNLSEQRFAADWSPYTHQVTAWRRLRETPPRSIIVSSGTGSGKTEVYLDLVREVVGRGRQVLVLVPEIGLTPQLLDRFRRRAGARVGVLHSGLAEGDRERAWLAARSGASDVLIGTRSAVFAPLPRLGLVVVDEEHDASFKQQEGFRYSARDLAVVRAQRADCPIVLGSATPALETLRNAQLGRYQPLVLPQRAGAAAAPRLDLVDVRGLKLQAGLAPVSRRLVQETLGRGEQVLLFLNRRGYAPVVMCHACGWVAGCRRCDARVTLRGEPRSRTGSQRNCGTSAAAGR